MGELLLIRHAERPDISVDTVGNEVLLTQKGKSDTLEFAKGLNRPIVHIRSSPIARCRQTAGLIAEAKGFPQQGIFLDTDLGDPGFIIEDGEQAWCHWQTKGHDAINEYLLSGSDQWTGFADLNSSVQCFSEKIRSHLKQSPNGLHIWVTHDTVLAAFASRVLKNPLTLRQWPRYLDYLSVNLKGDELHYLYSCHRSI